MPALPGAHQSFVTKGDAAIFHARACSRPPEPSKRMCMRKPMMVVDPSRVARNSLSLQGGDCRHSGRRAMRADPESRIVLHLRTSTRDSGFDVEPVIGALRGPVGIAPE